MTSETSYRIVNIGGVPCAVTEEGREIRADELEVGMEVWDSMGWWRQPLTSVRPFRGRIRVACEYIFDYASDAIVRVRS